MKKYILLLLLATFGTQAQTLQNPTYGNVKLKNNATDNSATKINVQENDGTINTISKSDLVNVAEVNDVPTLPLVGEVGKIYVVKNVNKIYRWNGTFYQELAGSDISGKEDIANKQNSLSVDGSNTKYPTVTAVNHNLSLRANYGSNLIIDEALIDGYYIDVMGNGAVNTAEGYSITSFIEVSKTSYLLSDTYQQWAVYDSDFTFITGSFSDEGGGVAPPVPYKKEIDIPPSARYIRLTIRNIEKDAFYIARKNLYAKEFSIVAKKGGDFSTVQAAVNASFENQTIYIYPGVYEETVNTVGRKVKLIGFDKSSTKITTNGGSYYFPPLECSGGTYAENITFEATSYNPVSHTINAYAVHMDFEGEGVTEFNNCSLISHQNAGIGAGLHNNQTLKLNNCDIIKYSDGAVFNGGALYFHNSPFPNEQNQILEVTGCRIFTDNGKAIIIDDARHNAGGVDINTIMTFSNNRVYSLTDNYDCVTYSNTPIDGGVSGRIRLSLDSYGNSIDKLNKIKFLDNFANQSFNGTKQFNEPLISRGYYLFGNAGSAEWKLTNDYNELNDFNIIRGSNVAFSINSSYQSTFSGTVTATNLSGTNTGDNAPNSLYSGLVTNATHTGEVTGSTALTITNGAVTNAKLANVPTATLKGRMSADTGVVETLTASQARTVLNVANGANNYVHPAKHLASIITQDASNRFVTDTEKSAWNAKEPAIASGTISQYWRGDKTWQEFPTIQTIDQTIIDGSTNAVSSNAVFDGLATKFPTPTGLTTNYLPKWNGSGFGNSLIFDNGTNIGIGTTTPNHLFTVEGNSTNTVIGLYDRHNAAGNRNWALASNQYAYGDFHIKQSNALFGNPITAGTSRFVIAADGNVLIGTTSNNEVDRVQVAGTISASPATTANQVVVKSQLDAAVARPYKVYTALLSQTGTNAPVATVLENTLGGTVVWTRVNTGLYSGTLTGAFTTNKTALLNNNPVGGVYTNVINSSTNEIIIQTRGFSNAQTDNGLTNTSIEIRVYL